MHVLTEFLKQCVPDDTHSLYNQAVDLLITYRDSTSYTTISSYVVGEDSPYPPEFRDVINDMLESSITNIIHDNGLIAEGDLPKLVKLGQSIKALTFSPDLDHVDNALDAFPDDATSCMQRVLEMHGGLDEFEFSEIVKLVAPSNLDRLKNHAMRTRELIEAEIEESMEEEEQQVLSLEVMEVKKQWLLKAKENNLIPDIVLKYIVDQNGTMGKPVEDLISHFRGDIFALQPSNPLDAAKTLVVFTVLSATNQSEIYAVAKQQVETVFDDMNYIVAVKTKITEMEHGDS